MSRNIPQVRKWLVNYWRDGKVIASRKVMAPTKLFAIWAAQDDVRAEGNGELLRLVWLKADRRTITPMKTTREAGRLVLSPGMDYSKVD